MKKKTLYTNGCSFTYGGGLDPWFLMIDGKPAGDVVGSYAVNVDYEKLLDELTYDERLTFYEDHDLRQTMVWPWFLKNHLNMENCVNDALGCGSNQRIVRTTLEWLQSQTPDTLNDTLAIIQLTETSRYEYFEPDYEQWSLCKVEVCMQESECQQVADTRNADRLSTYTIE